MRVRYADATGCPRGQFVVEVDSDEDRRILRSFLGIGQSPAEKGCWEWWQHGCTFDGSDAGPRSFNFGWSERKDSPGMKPIEQADAQEMLAILREAMKGALIPMMLGDRIKPVLSEYPEEPDLRRCPCCGGRPRLWKNNCSTETEITIQCMDGCGIALETRQSEAYAIAAWNKRTP